jgi:hypothetical protein
MPVTWSDEVDDVLASDRTALLGYATGRAPRPVRGAPRAPPLGREQGAPPLGEVRRHVPAVERSGSGLARVAAVAAG